MIVLRWGGVISTARNLDGGEGVASVTPFLIVGRETGVRLLEDRRNHFLDAALDFEVVRPGSGVFLADLLVEHRVAILE